MQDFDQTLEFISRVQLATKPEEICKRVLEVTRRYGVTAVVAAAVPSLNASAEEIRAHVLLNGWPEKWFERYLSRGYLRHDPLAFHLTHDPAPVKWQTVFESVPSGSAAMEIIRDASAFGMRDGVGLSLGTLEGTPVLISLAGERIEMSSEDLGVVSLVCALAVGRAIQIRTGQTDRMSQRELSSREIECIRWAARGKSEWEISQILGISEHTSEKHLLRAKAKLGAINRVHAVAEAIRRGYIS
jgi:LuxR family quorum sensing-dependent transcriptional regulator